MFGTLRRTRKKLQEARITIVTLTSDLWLLQLKYDALKRVREDDQRGRTDGVENPRVAEFPDYPVFPTYPGLPNMDASRCGTCGIEWKNATNYVCVRTDCPGGITYCSEVSAEGRPYPYADSYEVGSGGPTPEDENDV